MSTPPTEPSADQPEPPPAYGQPSYGSAPQPTGERPGELLDRFLARLVDGVVLGVAYVFLLFASALIFDGLLFTAVLAVLATAVQLTYFSYLESTRGQTLGKQLLKLRVVGPAGGHPTLEQAIRRNIWLALGLLGVIPVIGWISSLASLAAVILIAVGISKDTVNRQGWHDHFAGETRVLKIG